MIQTGWGQVKSPVPKSCLVETLARDVVAKTNLRTKNLEIQHLIDERFGSIGLVPANLVRLHGKSEETI